MDRLLKTERCLWYMDLRTGAIVLGHFDVALDILSILGSIVLMIYVYFLEQLATNNIYAGRYTVREEEAIFGAMLYIYATIYLLISVVCLIISITFLCGIFKNKPDLLMPQLVVYYIRFCFQVIGLIGIFLDAIENPQYGFLSLMIYVAYGVLLWHKIAVVQSFYQKIKDERNSRGGVVYHQADTIPPQNQISMVSPQYSAQYPAQYPTKSQPQYPINTESPQYPDLHV